MAINRTSPKKGKVVDIPTAPTIGTATAGAELATVAFTAATRGGPATTYTALSNPGSVTGTGSSSPVTVSGLTAGTAYTFTVRGNNATGSSEYGSASNSITALAGSAYESIATATPNGTDVTFSSIPSGYKHLQVRIIARTTRNDASVDTVYFRFNGDTGNNYNVHTLSGNGSTTSAAHYSAPTVLWGPFSTPTAQSSANMFSASVIDILDYTNTSKFTTTRTLGGTDTNGSGSANYFTGLWKNTAAITSIRFFAEGNYVNGSHFALYGIKG
jgi:trimeric autotransporter adhesin